MANGRLNVANGSVSNYLKILLVLDNNSNNWQFNLHLCTENRQKSLKRDCARFLLGCVNQILSASASRLGEYGNSFATIVANVKLLLDIAVLDPYPEKVWW